MTGNKLEMEMYFCFLKTIDDVIIWTHNINSGFINV